MSCFGYDESTWRQHPSRCTYSEDELGGVAGMASFVGLRWSGWGKGTATARGHQHANHRRKDDSLPRYRTTVQVSGRNACGNISYYSRIRFKTSWPKTTARYSEWLPLTKRC
jgi:hypothetical protein